jgi:anti-anti-sigma factor
LESALDRAVTGDHPAVAIECAHVSFMDIAGARPLMSARTAAVRRGKEFVLLDPPPRVSYVLSIVGLGDAVLALEPPAWPLARDASQRPPPHLTPPAPPG